MSKANLCRRERKKMEAKARIIRSARHLFEKNGYESTSIEEISEMANLSKSTFFKYFYCKESVLTGIAQEEIADIFEMIADDSFDSYPPIEKIKNILIRLLEDAIPYLHLTGRVVFSTVINNRNSTSPFYQIRKVLENLVEEGQAKGEISSDFSSASIVTSLMGCYYGVIFKWFGEGGKAGSVRELEHILDIVLRGIVISN